MMEMAKAAKYVTMPAAVCNNLTIDYVNQDEGSSKPISVCVNRLCCKCGCNKKHHSLLHNNESEQQQPKLEFNAHRQFNQNKIFF